MSDHTDANGEDPTGTSGGGGKPRGKARMSFFVRGKPARNDKKVHKNSAVGIKPLARSPYEEMADVAERGDGGDGEVRPSKPPPRKPPPPPPRRARGREKPPLSRSHPSQHISPGMLAAYSIEDDDRRTVENNDDDNMMEVRPSKPPARKTPPPPPRRARDRKISPGMLAAYSIVDDDRNTADNNDDENTKSSGDSSSIELQMRMSIERKTQMVLGQDPRGKKGAFQGGRRKAEEGKEDVVRGGSYVERETGQSAGTRNFRRASSLNISFRAGADDENEPLTRPSAPVPRRRPNRSAAIDVDETRASLKQQLNDDSSTKGFAENLEFASTQELSFRSSLKVCLEDMGFETEDIAAAVEYTNATSCEDAAKVVAWLSDQGQQQGESNQGGEEWDLNDEEDETVSCDETNYTKHTYGSAATSGTNNTNGTAETHESDERVQELKESMRKLGFCKKDIKRHKELYRQHTNEMGTQDFIAVILDAEHNNGGEGCDPIGPADTPPSPIAQITGNKLAESRKRDNNLVRSITEMGFEEDRVREVIDEMCSSGVSVSENDADKVLGVLLGGSSPGGPNNPPRSKSNFDRIYEGDAQCHLGDSMIRSRDRSTYPSATKQPSYTERYRQQEQSEEKSHTIEITPGQHARLLKGRQTWDAMHDGTAVSALCIICNVTLQCCPEADYVLCPDCNSVSPLKPNAMDDTGSGDGTGSRRWGSMSSMRNVLEDTGACSGSFKSRGLSRGVSMGCLVGAVGLGYKRDGDDL